MLYFIIAWIFLTLICFSIGIGLLNLLNASCFERKGDRFIIAVWLGLIILCVSLLATSLLLPLSPVVGLAVALSLVSLSVLSQSTRNELTAFSSLRSNHVIICFLSLEFLVSALTSQQITWFDTGLYHLGIIRWLAQFGAVPGLALINSKFGFTSAWFALAAPLNPTFLGAKIGGITNGFIFLIAILQVIIIIIQGIKNKFYLSDWFLVFNSLVPITLYTVTTFTGSPILISFSADVAVTFLIVITAWAILIIASQDKRSIISELNSPLDARLIVLILSVGAVTIKLSALPLIPIGFIFYSFGNKSIFQRIIWGIIFIILLISPLIIFGVTTSGCPLFPSTVMCLDLPWSVPIQTAQKEIQYIQYWRLLLDPEKSGFNMIFEVVLRWFKLSKKSQIMTLLIIALIPVCIYNFRKYKTRAIPGHTEVIALGIIGIAFIMVLSPLIRFGLGYFILIPSFFLAQACQAQSHKIHRQTIIQTFLLKSGINSLITVQFISLFLVAITLVIMTNDEVQSRWLLPPEVPSVKVITAQVNDVKYIYPDNWTVKCWVSELPCTEVPIKHNIKLRNSSQGIGSGFIHAD